MAEYARIINRTTLQTPVHQYVHTDTGRQVILIGVVPVGEAGYYRSLRDLIEQLELDGVVVHCEGGSALALRTAEPPGLSSHESMLWSELRRLKAMQDAAIAALGWTGQVQGLSYPMCWRFVDMPFIEILRTVGAEVLLREARLLAKPLVWYQDHPARALAWFRLTAVVDLRRMAKGDPARGAQGDELIVEQRNDVALSGVEATDHDMVLIWSPEHLPGLDTELRARGFHRIAVDWYDVMQLPTTESAIWDAIRSTRRATHRQLTSPGAAMSPLRRAIRPAHNAAVPPC